jgi:D-alanine-D-alanine ligase
VPGPRKLSHDVLVNLEAAALQAYDILGCRDLARVDFRIRDGVPYFIEANPLPGLNPESGDLVFLANRMNISYEQLIEKILDAMRRLGLK